MFGALALASAARASWHENCALPRERWQNAYDSTQAALSSGVLAHGAKP